MRVSGNRLKVSALRGGVDFAMVDDLGAHLDALLAVDETEVELDFSCVHYLQSAALGLLLNFYQGAQAAGKTVHMHCPVSVRDAIENLYPTGFVYRLSE